MKLHKSVADYAAIAVAPILIFIMISALANFLVLMLYHGGFPQRVAWTLLMFTMGSVAIARIAIEQNRAYSLGYAAALGGATFVVMSQFIGSPIFCAFILGVIAYLADAIVRDCTIIEDAVDASGEGLIDAGRLFVKKQIDGAADQASEHTKKQHQPGRTVMYLALGALPLFGFGQFMLRSDSASWTRAQVFLAFYLFAALALLVTTSFLGLRRYLRQRNAEMPLDVTVSWLGGGIAMIAAVLLIAYLVPLPGQALASIELPEFIDSTSDTSASQYGTGDEGADNSNPEAATTSEDQNGEDKEIHSETMKEGGEAGAVGDGKRDDGPAGKQQGGKQQSTGSEGESKESKQQSGGDQPSKDQRDAEADQQNSKQPSDNQGGDDKQPPPTDQQPSESGDQQTNSSGSNPSATESIKKALSNATSGLGLLMKLLIMLLMAAVVARFVWLNWDRFVRWLQGLLNADEPDRTESFPELELDPTIPPRPFSAYRNPIGSESDLRRVVVITFQAFEAWAREQGASRGKDETPSEFVQRVSKTIANVGAPVSQVVDAYNRIVYGRGGATQRDVDAATQVWRLMR